jgi:hypothetical protein
MGKYGNNDVFFNGNIMGNSSWLYLVLLFFWMKKTAENQVFSRKHGNFSGKSGLVSSKISVQ